jgi:hypothetical protein
MPWEQFIKPKQQRKCRYDENTIVISKHFKGFVFQKAFLKKHDIEFDDGKRINLYHNNKNASIGFKITTEENGFQIFRCGGNKSTLVGAIFCGDFMNRFARNAKPQGYKVEYLPDGLMVLTPELIKTK